MILIRYARDGLKRTADFRDIFFGRTALLVGGAPSLIEQPYKLMEQRGVLSMAMNNAAIHFRPTLWVSGDRPDCFEPQILEDPGIMKFAPVSAAGFDVNGHKYHACPNIFFYIQKPNVPWDEYLDDRAEVPWYTNTLMAGIHLLYGLGVRRIILAGSDFGVSKDGRMYAHATKLGDLEKKWNMDLYNHQVRELRLLKPVFERFGLTMMDCSKNSRLSQAYEHVSMERAVELCLEGFPHAMLDPATLPHCSKFASEDIKQAVAGWPGHKAGEEIPEEEHVADPEKDDLQLVI